MSTSKHIDQICVAVLILTILLSVIFVNGNNLGIALANRTTGYEQRLFRTDTVHTVDIVMEDWDSFIETCENEEYWACTVLIDGEKYGNIGIRAKGNTSLSSVRSLGSQRYSFKLEFDQYENGKNYYGLDKLCLNNLIQDNTMMKDYLVYQMMADFGVDTPLCSYVYMTVNGEDWGLYLAVEGVEDSFLERNYGTDTGELYKPDSVSFGGGRGQGKEFDMNQFDFDSKEEAGDGEVPQMPDGGEFDGKMPQRPGGGRFNGEMPQMPNGGEFEGEMPQMSDGGSFDGKMPQRPGGGNGGMGSDDVKLKYIDENPDSYPNIFDNAKTDVSGADKKRLVDALKNLSEYTNLEKTLDTEEVLRYFVVHNFVVNGDSYTGSMIHNYYLHEKDGQLGIIPWDYNLAFGTFQGGNASESVNESIDSPVSGGNVDDRPMVGWIFSDEAYTKQYHELFSQFVAEWIDSGKLTKMIEETAELLRPYVEKDPTKFCTVEEFEKGIQAVSRFVTLRGEAVSRQLSGDDTPVETTDLNTSDMGTMGGGMGGRFDKGNAKERPGL